jgi:tRNA(fMet)-specific endonuclease VapC
MSGAIVDTDVISYFEKKDSRARLYEQHLSVTPLIVSFMTVAELERWALSRKWSTARRERLAEMLDHFIIHFPDRLLCAAWADITERARLKGFLLASADAWIAATAIHFGLPLVTHNRNDFDFIDGLDVVSEAPL